MPHEDNYSLVIQERHSNSPDHQKCRDNVNERNSSDKLLTFTIRPDQLRLPSHSKDSITLLVENKNTCAICFTFDTNSPETLEISPRSGRLYVGEKVEIAIRRPKMMSIRPMREHLIFKITEFSCALNEAAASFADNCQEKYDTSFNGRGEVHPFRKHNKPRSMHAKVNLINDTDFEKASNIFENSNQFYFLNDAKRNSSELLHNVERGKPACLTANRLQVNNDTYEGNFDRHREMGVFTEDGYGHGQHSMKRPVIDTYAEGEKFDIRHTTASGQHRNKYCQSEDPDKHIGEPNRKHLPSVGQRHKEYCLDEQVAENIDKHIEDCNAEQTAGIHRYRESNCNSKLTSERYPDIPYMKKTTAYEGTIDGSNDHREEQGCKFGKRHTLMKDLLESRHRQKQDEDETFNEKQEHQPSIKIGFPSSFQCSLCDIYTDKGHIHQKWPCKKPLPLKIPFDEMIHADSKGKGDCQANHDYLACMNNYTTEGLTKMLLSKSKCKYETSPKPNTNRKPLIQNKDIQDGKRRLIQRSPLRSENKLECQLIHEESRRYIANCENKYDVATDKQLISLDVKDTEIWDSFKRNDKGFLPQSSRKHHRVGRKRKNQKKIAGAARDSTQRKSNWVLHVFIILCLAIVAIVIALNRDKLKMFYIEEDVYYNVPVITYIPYVTGLPSIHKT